VPHVESPFFDEWLDTCGADQVTRDVAVALRRNGFAIFDFPDPDFERRAESIKASLVDKFDWRGWRLGGHAKGEGLRVQDAWRSNADVRSLAVNEGVLRLLRTLYGREPRPFQTLNFPVGTQQSFHSDSVHFSSIPERYMCGVWVALEDIAADSGPLVYYPGSHAWPSYFNESLDATTASRRQLDRVPHLWNELVRLHGVAPARFLARKGQALIWAANLLHGGDRHLDPDRTRWSQVTHYYFDGCGYYTPLFSDPFHGSILWRSPTDIRTGAPMPNVVGGTAVDADFIAVSGLRAQLAMKGEMGDAAAGSGGEVAVARQELAELRARLTSMERSLSWRLTAPLRRLLDRPRD
jgi:hypothetical protein